MDSVRKIVKLFLVLIPIALLLNTVAILTSMFTLESGIGFVLMLILWPSLAILMLAWIGRYNAEVTTPVTWRLFKRAGGYTGELRRVVQDPVSGKEIIVIGDAATIYRTACLASRILDDIISGTQWTILDETGTDISGTPLANYDGLAFLKLGS